jgi:exodeoxyribonuclease-5
MSITTERLFDKFAKDIGHIEPKQTINYKDSLRGDQGDAFDAIKIFIDQPTGGMFLLDGFAGTGKTYLMNVVIQYIGDVTKREILVTAPTHKAVKVIRQHVHDSRVDFATVHSALGLKEHIDGHGKISFVKDKYAKCKLDKIQFLIVDETSMLADELYEEIKMYASRGLKVLFVGDSLQIPPVNKPDSIPFDRDYRREDGIGHTKMETIIRQDAGNPIIDHSFKIREKIYRPCPVPIKEPVKNNQGSITFIPAAVKDDYIKDEILPEYSKDEFQQDNDHIKILAWRNKTVDKYNKMIRQYIYGQEALAKYLPGERLIAMEPLVEDKQVLIHNSEEMEILDYTLEEWDEDGQKFKYYNTHVNVLRDDEGYSEWIVKLIHEDSEKDYNDLLKLQSQYAKSLAPGSFQARSAWIDFFTFKRTFFWVRYSYAITCHKSQGSTYNIAVVMEDDIDVNHDTYEKNRILYTACTRPRRDLVVIY